MNNPRATPNHPIDVSRLHFVGYVLIWLVYVVLVQQLYVRTDIRNFETEGYITSMTIGEAWQFANRPIVVPMIYKAAQNYGVHIVRFQYLLSILAWTFLGLVVSRLVSHPLCRFAGFVLILAFSLCREVYFWNSLLLSESLSHSFLILLIGVCSWLVFGNLPMRTKRMAMVSTIVFGVIWGFTRDANAYLLLVWGGGLAFWAGFSRAGGQRWMLVAATIFIFGFVVQYRHAELGKRWQLSYINILGERILPDPSATSFFVAGGMPLNDEFTRYRNQRGWAFYPDHDMRMGLGTWLDEDGKQVYATYLASRPVDTLLAPMLHWRSILAYQHRLSHLARLYTSEDSPRWQRIVGAWVYADWMVLPIVLLASVGLMVLDFVRRRDDRYLMPTVLLASGYCLALVAWHSDADSIERHAFQVGLLVRLSVWGIMLIFIDRRLETTYKNEPHAAP